MQWPPEMTNEGIELAMPIVRVAIEEDLFDHPEFWSCAVDGDLECCAYLAHPGVSQPAEALDQYGHRNTFDRVEIDRRTARNRVLIGLENNFAR